MRKLTLSLVFLSLFTNVEKAAEIEGDLIEESQAQGKLWFILHVLLTSFSLLKQSFMKNPIPALLLAYAIYELVFKIVYWLMIPLWRYLVYEINLSRVSVMLGLYLSMMIFIYLVGSALVRFFPKNGTQIALLSVLLILFRGIALQEFNYGGVALFVLFPILLGCILSQKKYLCEISAS